jgi:signal transduction histidine kinase
MVSGVMISCIKSKWIIVRHEVMLPTSIRWRLPLSYALIALLATIALGIVLLTTLRGYYAQREYDHLWGNAMAIGDTVSEMYQYDLSDDQIALQLRSLAFLSQARIRLLNMKGDILIDSGEGLEPRTIALSYAPGMDSTDGPFQIGAASVPSGSEQFFDGPFSGGEEWGAAIELGPQRVTRPVLPPDDPNTVDLDQRYFFMAVAGTPYGFGLNSSRERVLDLRSDQTVETPLFGPANQLLGYIKLSDGPAYGTEIVNGVARALMGAGAVAVLLAILVGWVISRQMSAPLLLLADATRCMADGNLTARVTTDRNDEFGLLASSFNHMAGRVENTVTTLRRFVADAAHELHTPITALHANLELAATDDDDAQRLTFIQRAQEQLKRLEVMTSSLLDLSKLEAGDLREERKAVDLNMLIAQVSELYASRAEQAGLSFKFDTPLESIVALVDEGQLRRVIGNLLDNAIKFTPENGIIQIGLCHHTNGLQIWVHDTGIGIPIDDIPHLFNRFRRGRNASAYPGSGLGLAIIKAIVEGHGGQVTVESSPQGTRFSLQLPAMA